MKEYGSIGPVVEKYREYKSAVKAADEANELLKETSDDEFKALLKEELNTEREKVSNLKKSLKYFFCLKTLTIIKT